VIEVPAERLSADILRAVIEEFILREGTDYGSYEVSLENKIDQVRGQLSRGEVLITFDPATENCNLLTRNQFQRYQSEQQQQSQEQDQQPGSEF